MASEDDTAYKQLFAYPEMVRDLLLGFVPGDWVHQLDLTSFERVNGSYVSDGGTIATATWSGACAWPANGSTSTCCSNSSPAPIRGWPCVCRSALACFARI